MEETATHPARKSRSETTRRLFWFVAGSGVNYLLISTPFHWLKSHTTLPVWAISACSLALSTTFFFGWNYFVNFRTNARKRDALARYVGAVGVMFVLSWATLTTLKHFNAHMSFAIHGTPLDLDIVATQFFLAGLKFFLYHKWVFPAPTARAES